MTTIHIRSELVYWGVMAAGASVMCLATCLFRNTIEIVLTAIIGSYIFLRGLSAFFGGFPTRDQLNEIHLNSQDAAKWPASFFIYGVALVAMIAVSIIIQKKQEKKASKEF